MDIARRKLPPYPPLLVRAITEGVQPQHDALAACIPKLADAICAVPWIEATSVMQAQDIAFNSAEELASRRYRVSPPAAPNPPGLWIEFEHEDMYAGALAVWMPRGAGWTLQLAGIESFPGRAIFFPHFHVSIDVAGDGTLPAKLEILPACPATFDSIVSSWVVIHVMAIIGHLNADHVAFDHLQIPPSTGRRIAERFGHRPDGYRFSVARMKREFL